MAKKYTVTARAELDRFERTLSKDDAATFEFDFSPWQAENNTITEVNWVVEYGQVGISDEDLTDGIASALLTFSQSGRSLVAITADTGVQRKKIWLEVFANDRNLYTDDYGMRAL